ncbi:flagellar biosynthesis protein FliS [Brevibacillus panacihumi W25]|uniref:Flagellar biosynthesis protein FliS n=1 Tax=Brevibacillus panacihumi W25 TaxID=1408254 RepID=V6MIZ9_9BACL|nr:flagellar export chaperone FliS [Brevibacillus panacihumi]EST55413.1 flagellar biosynthesis protein FliS [Brevibacillus panacihumi W25]
MSYNVAQTYQANQVTTAPPEELTLMLYNGGIKFLRLAKAFLLEKKLDKVHENALKVQAILSELMNTLNPAYAVSEQMRSMYDYMLRRTIEANMKKDAAIFDEVEEFFIQFRDTWKQAIVLSKNRG